MHKRPGTNEEGGAMRTSCHRAGISPTASLAVDNRLDAASSGKTALIARAASNLVEKAKGLVAAREYSPTIYGNIHAMQVRYGKELKALEINVDGKKTNAYSALMQAKAEYASILEPPGGCGGAWSRMDSIPPTEAPDISASAGRSSLSWDERKPMPIRDLKAAVESLITRAYGAQVYDQDIAAHLFSICSSEKDRLPSISVKVDGLMMSAEHAIVRCQERLASLPASQGPW